MKRLYILSASMLVIMALSFILFSTNNTDKINIAFLNSYGLEVNNKSIENERVKIPEDFDLVYEGYNELQKKAGLDLREYRGEEGIRYTYIVRNFPYYMYGISSDEIVRANVISINNIPVGGDVMIVNAGGFMLDLNFLNGKRD